jgi:aminoglycoside 6'-N-acetyltransferase I
MLPLSVRPYRADDFPAWARLRQELWPEVDENETRRDLQTFLAAPERYEILVAESDGVVVGIIELSIRNYAEGCVTDAVGYVEGWYVAPQARRSGVGSQLVAAGEAWARSKGCSEMASDAELPNTSSQQAHSRLGYVEVCRNVCYRKDL